MKQGIVRIIAGKWRGRRLKVPDVKDLRPTPDRVRETIFNWLMPVINDTYCLDLFAGSGVLGFEALSRGAKHVVMIDQSEQVVTLLKEEVLQFGADNATVYRATVPNQLKKPDHLFNIVFLDPPYQADLLLLCCRYLEENQFLAPKAYIYLEADRLIEDNDLPIGWQIVKSKQAGQVFYHLAQRNS